MPSRHLTAPEYHVVTPIRIKNDLQGVRFGKLTALGLYKESKRQSKWVCLCDCGYYSIPFGFSLTSGESRSCGCVAANKSKGLWKSERAEHVRNKMSLNASNAKHRLSHHKLYGVWADIKQRCLNKNHRWYPSYGGRGIKICSRWEQSFVNFYNDMSNGYHKGLSIGRINNDKNYCPENCRWETPSQQQRNKTNVRIVDTPLGKMSIAAASERFNLTRGCIDYRIKAGWNIDKIFYEPSIRE